MSALRAGSLVSVAATWRLCYSSPDGDMQKMCPCGRLQLSWSLCTIALRMARRV